MVRGIKVYYFAKAHCIQALSDIASSLVVGCPRVLEFIQLVDVVRVIPPYAVAQEVLAWRVVRAVDVSEDA